MTPGSVPDTYDPEFGTAENAEFVELALRAVIGRIDAILGADLCNIVRVVRAEGEWPMHQVALSEQELRVMRYGLHRALETLGPYAHDNYDLLRFAEALQQIARSKTDGFAAMLRHALGMEPSREV